MVPSIQITNPTPTTIQTWRVEKCPGSGAPLRSVRVRRSLRENARDLDREAKPPHSLTERTSHILTKQSDCNPPNDQE